MVSVGMAAVALFGLAAVVFAVTLRSVLVERFEVSRTLRAMRAVDTTGDSVRAQQLAPSFWDRVVGPAIARFMDRAQRMLPLSSADRLRKELQQAGSPPNWDAERVLRMKLLGLVVGAVSFPVVLGGAAAGPVGPVFLVPLGAGIGYYIPDWILRARARQRQEAIRRALPDMLDVLAITVEAGLSFDSAMMRLTARMNGPLADEFNRVLREVQLGKPRVQALRDLAERSTIGELKSFVLAMVQADVYGVSVGRVLKVQSQDVRMKRRQRAEEAAQKIPVKIVFPLVFCIMPALFVVLLGPAALSVLRMLVS